MKGFLIHVLMSVFEWFWGTGEKNSEEKLNWKQTTAFTFYPESDPLFSDVRDLCSSFEKSTIFPLLTENVIV